MPHLPHVRAWRSIISLALGTFFAFMPLSFAQTLTLPAPGLDVALSPSGIAVVSLSGGNLVWVRAADGTVRTPAFDSADCSVLVNRKGTRAYFRGYTTPHMFLLEIGADQDFARGYDTAPTDLALTPDEKLILTGLDNKTVLISGTVHFEDFAAIPVSGLPRSIVITPDSKFALVATGPSGNRIAKIDITNRAITQQIKVNSSISKLAISPDGKKLYAVASRRQGGSSFSRSLEVFNVESGRREQSVPLSLSGSQVPTFDIEADTAGIFVSSTVPFTVAGKTAGVVRLPIRANRVSQPRLFSTRNLGSLAISLDRKGKKLGVLKSNGLSVSFLKVP